MKPHYLLLALVVPLFLAACAPTGSDGKEGPTTAPTAKDDADGPQPNRREQYIPPREALVHRAYLILDQPAQRPMTSRRWGGQVSAVIGDEVWNWQLLSEGRVYQGEALVRNGRPVDGYILRALAPPPAPTTAPQG